MAPSKWLKRLAVAVAFVALGLTYGVVVERGYGVVVGVVSIAVLLLVLLYDLGEYLYAHGFRTGADSTGVRIYWPSVEEFREHTVVVRCYTPKPDGTSEMSLEEMPRGQFNPYVKRHKNCRECGTVQAQMV